MIKKGAVAFLLVFIALAERLWFDLGPNIELITLVSVIASIYLGRRWGVGVAVVVLILSDLVIGNTMILIFTWSAFGLIGYGGGWLKKKAWWVSGGYGLAASLFFYFYTNLGVWLVCSLYPRTLQGLIDCYMMGLPFLRLQAVSNMIMLPAGLAVIEHKNVAIKVTEKVKGWIGRGSGWSKY